VKVCHNSLVTNSENGEVKMTNVNTTGLTQAQGSSLFAGKDVMQTASPTTGSTVVMTDDSNNGTLVLTPAANLAALTVQLPSDANSALLQIRRISTTKSITALTMTGATTILDAPASMNAGDLVSFQKTAANTWMRMV